VVSDGVGGSVRPGVEVLEGLVAVGVGVVVGLVRAVLEVRGAGLGSVCPVPAGARVSGMLAATGVGGSRK